MDETTHQAIDKKNIILDSLNMNEKTIELSQKTLAAALALDQIFLNIRMYENKELQENEMYDKIKLRCGDGLALEEELKKENVELNQVGKIITLIKKEIEGEGTEEIKILHSLLQQVTPFSLSSRKKEQIVCYSLSENLPQIEDLVHYLKIKIMSNFFYPCDIFTFIMNSCQYKEKHDLVDLRKEVINCIDIEEFISRTRHTLAKSQQRQQLQLRERDQQQMQAIDEKIQQMIQQNESIQQQLQCIKNMFSLVLTIFNNGDEDVVQ